MLTLRIVIPFVVFFVGLVGCRSEKGSVFDGGGDHADVGAADVCGNYSGLQQSCGENVVATGTTPLGSFNATSIWTTIDIPCQTGREKIELSIGDTQSKDTLVLNVLIPSGDAGTGLVGTHAVSASLHSLAACQPLVTSGTAEFTQASPPNNSGMAWGSFSLDRDGFAIAGTFRANYCGVTTPPGCP